MIGAEALAGAERAGRQVSDLRPRRGARGGPGRIRVIDTWVEIPVLGAFDLVATVPVISTTVPAGG